MLSQLTDKINSKEINDDNIYLVFQFFISNNKARQNEIKFCLKRNIELGLFKKIIMLNERIYTSEELGLTDLEMKNIDQININHRLKFSSAFLEIHLKKIKGYVVLCNSDIFFDKTINNLRKTSLSIDKSLYSLLRFEYTHDGNIENSMKNAKLFNHPLTNKPRSDSQDVWIYHTQQMEINDEFIQETDFMLGVPGCDNKITYIFNKHGFKCYNEPIVIKNYHYHVTRLRTYSGADAVPRPYLYVEPNY